MNLIDITDMTGEQIDALLASQFVDITDMSSDELDALLNNA